MGNVCEKNPKEEEELTRVRRRLSIGAVGLGGEDFEVTDADRGLLQNLADQDLISLLNDNSCPSSPAADGKIKRCLSSTMDNKVGRINSFTEKAVVAGGDRLDDACGVGYSCMKGLKPESPNQDSWSVLRVDECFSIYAVYDGHGIHGHTISNFVKDSMPKLLLQDKRFWSGDTPALLKESFGKLQRLIQVKYASEAAFSGTTASVVIHDHAAKTLTVAHAGDCTVVIARQDGVQLKGTAITRDHKPNLDDERERIQKSGGRVVWDGFFNHRVVAKDSHRPGLNMSRCLGDLYGHQKAGLSAVPEIAEIDVTASEAALFICSDGVWEFIKPQESVDLVVDMLPHDMTGACQKLAKHAWDRWVTEEGDVVDDITAMMINLRL